MIHRFRIEIEMDDNTWMQEDDKGLTPEELERLKEKVQFLAETMGMALGRKRYPVTAVEAKAEYLGATRHATDQS